MVYFFSPFYPFHQTVVDGGGTVNQTQTQTSIDPWVFWGHHCSWGQQETAFASRMNHFQQFQGNVNVDF